MKKFWAGTDGQAATAVVAVCVAEMMLVLVWSTVATLVRTVVVREVEVILSVASTVEVLWIVEIRVTGSVVATDRVVVVVTVTVASRDRVRVLVVVHGACVMVVCGQPIREHADA